MPKASICLAALLIGAATPVLAAAAAAPAASPATSDSAIRAQLSAIVAGAYDANGPGAAVIVTRGGKTLLADARGMANIAAKRPIRADDRFYLASITKMFTAATVAMLAAEGKLSLDDPLSKFLPGFPEPSARATVRQLLNHSSGVKDFSKTPGFIAANRDKDFTMAQLVELSRAQAPAAPPGTAWEYNNGGYTLLGAIIEKVTGKAWDEAVAESISRPLGLRSIHRGMPALSVYDGADASAKPHSMTPPSIASSAGALVGNAADLARFVAALHHGKLVPAPIYRQMIAPAALVGGRTAPYGFGFRIGRLLGTPTYYQGGAMRGTRTETLYLPRQDLFVAVLANSDTPRSEPRALAERLAAAALGQPFPEFRKTATDLAAAKPWLGRYTDGPRQFLLIERGGSLWLASAGSSARQVHAFGPNRFFFNAASGDWFELVAGAGGSRTLRFHVAEDREAHDMLRTGGLPETGGPAALNALAGSYRTETDVVLTIALSADGQLSVSQGGKEVGPLRAIEGGRFAIDGTPMRLEFVKEGERVTGLKLYRGARTLNATRVP